MICLLHVSTIFCYGQSLVSESPIAVRTYGLLYQTRAFDMIVPLLCSDPYEFKLYYFVLPCRSGWCGEAFSLACWAQKCCSL